MGLDMCCGNMRFRMGSYSCVMVQVQGVLRAYILFLKESTPRHVRTEMDVALQRVENRRLARAIEDCGEDETRLRALSPRMYKGIVQLVLGIPSLGSWTAVEAREVLQALAIVRPYLSRIPELEPYLEKKSVLPVESILQASVRSGDNIHFF